MTSATADPVSNDRYDVVVIGGAFAGSSLALLLKRWAPGTRILVVERTTKFGRKVGEATVEMSGMFLQKVLGQYDHLSKEHLSKHGLRHWFADRPETTLQEMSESGPTSVAALPSFQLDRSKLDEKLLADAQQEGVELLRPGHVRDIETGWPESKVIVEHEGVRRTIRCRWLIDGSGRRNYLGRKLGLFRPNHRHPTAAVWARFRGVKNLDGPEVMGTDPQMPKMPPMGAERRLATNHFCGYGWWCWLIPLAGGQTSIGLVYDKRLFRWESEGKLRERFLHFLHGQPGLRELIDGAEIDGKDFTAYEQLSHCTTKYMDKGWAMVGDAAAFIDPYYSPGLDHAAFSVYSTARILQEDLTGTLDEQALSARIDTHNERFLRSFRNWFEALYLDKYEIFGDAELTVAAFYWDTATYYLGVVGPALRDVEEYNNPILGLDILPARIVAGAMRLFSRRMVKLARFRRQTGSYGRRNRGWKKYHKRFEPGLQTWRLLMAGARIWLGAELHMVWGRLRRGWPTIEPPHPAPVKGQDAEMAQA